MIVCFSGIFAENAKKDGGTIDDLFTDEESEYTSEDYVNLRSKIEAEITDDLEEKIWPRLVKKLQKQLDILEEEGNSVIPETTYAKIANNGGVIPEGVAKKVKKRGVLIVRNTIPEATVHNYFTDLIKYLYVNNAIPSDNKVNKHEVNPLTA